MVNFGPLTTEICWRVWGTQTYFNGFRVLAALLHGSLVVGVSQTAALNRGRHLYSAGRPSRWALAHTLVETFFPEIVGRMTKDDGMLVKGLRQEKRWSIRRLIWEFPLKMWGIPVWMGC